MRAAAAAVAAIGLASLALAVPATAGKTYSTVVTGSYLGEGVFQGTVGTPARGRINGRSVRRRCANRRRIESATHTGDFTIKFRTTSKGHWRFFMPEEPGRRIKVFVLAKRLPDGSFCSFAKLAIEEPELDPGP